MGYWKLRCKNCNNEWKLLVSFPLKREFKRLYHYCVYCGKNTFHEIIEFVENGTQGEL
ncbi:MAG: hypothetical protein QXP02_00075 [Desulfurococcaceae archaeon]